MIKDDSTQEFISQAARGAPALAGAGAAIITLNELVAIVTLIYVLIQTAYLARKWWVEERERKAAVEKIEGWVEK